METSTTVTHAKFKVVVLGDQGVGKTSLIVRFVHDSFDPTKTSTIGVDLLSKAVPTSERVVRLLMWDTAGQERFRALIPSYIKDSAFAVVVYDVCDPTSFLNAKTWVRDVRSYRGDDVLIGLVGNKADRAAERKVSPEEGEDLAQELNTLFFEVSAMSGTNVNNLFNTVASRVAETNEGILGVHGHGFGKPRTSRKQGRAACFLRRHQADIDNCRGTSAESQ